MNTRPHCRTSPPIGIGGQPMPGGITTNSRTGFAASRPSAGFRIPSANCWISPGATMPEPIGSAAEPQTDDRRTARMGLVGDSRVAGVRNVAADHQALAPTAICRSRCVCAFQIVDRAVLSLKRCGGPFLFDRVKKPKGRRFCAAITEFPCIIGEDLHLMPITLCVWMLSRHFG